MKLWWACVSLVLSVRPAQADDLGLLDVLRSARTMHPGIDVADAGVEEARQGVLSARGAFDLKVYAEGGIAPLGKYEKPRAAVGLSQPTSISGLQLWTRYENGADFAPYDGALVTSEAGRASLGVLLPLLQGRAIDEARLGRKLSELELEIAEQERRQARASILSKAAVTWWKWVITGRKLEAYRQLLAQAEERRRFLEEQVKAGAIAAVELLDNERVLSARRAKLSSLELEFRQLSLSLGMFRRSDSGEPLPARPDELPELPALGKKFSFDTARFDEEKNSAPGLVIYDLSLRVLETELRHAQNQQEPRLDLEIYSSQSFGPTRPYSSLDSSVTETAAGGKLKFSWDVQRRKARGKAGMLRAKQRALSSKKRLFIDQLGLAVAGQVASLDAQYEVARASRAATQGAERVSDAERQSFEMGQSSILSVNLREQAVLSTYIDELEAIFEYQRAWISLHELLGSERVGDYLPPRGRALDGGTP